LEKQRKVFCCDGINVIFCDDAMANAKSSEDLSGRDIDVTMVSSGPAGRTLFDEAVAFHPWFNLVSSDAIVFNDEYVSGIGHPLHPTNLAGKCDAYRFWLIPKLRDTLQVLAADQKVAF